MTVRVDVNELFQLLRLTPPDQNVMLVGRHGIGKSQIVAEYFSSVGMRVVPFFLGQMSDPGDLIGLLHKDATTGRSEFLPPYWWPTEGHPIVLFLDELNRARPEILQSVMELVLNKTLAGKRLPAGSVIVSAVNEGDEYQLTDLDPALVSRFNLYQFSPTVDDWLLWAEKTQIDPRIATFIQSQPQFLDGNPNPLDAPELTNTSGLVKTPDRRAWARVSKFIAPIETLDASHIKLIAGMVGSPAATAFRKSLATPLPVTPVDVLLNFAKHRKILQKLSLAELVLLNEQLLLWIAAGRCPSNETATVRENLLAYAQLLQQRKLNEAVAHFVSLIEKPRYEPAMSMVAESIELTQLLAQYMEGLRIS